MTLDDIVYNFRVLAGDLVEPYLWDSTLVQSYAESAENEACSRKALLTSESIDELCKISIVSGTSVYPKHTKVRQIFSAILTQDDETIELHLTDPTELNYISPGWRYTKGPPKYLIINDSTVQMVPPPEKDGVLTLYVSHIPVTSIIDNAEPTIDEINHYPMIYYMLYLAYNKRDADTENPAKALEFESLFASHFGPKQELNTIKSIRQVREANRTSGWI